MIDEGYIKFDIDWTETPASEGIPGIDELIRWRDRLFDVGLVGYYDDIGVGYGNLSARIGDSTEFVISGTQTGHIPRTGPEHYAVVTHYDIAANRVSCRGPVKASSESMTHAALYELDPACRSVVHVHHPSLWARSVNAIPTTAADVAYGTPAMAREFERLYRETDFATGRVAAMAGHDAGLLAVGPSVAAAAQRLLDLLEQHGG